MTVKEWISYLSVKNEHYPISDVFIRDYQQSPSNVNGYVYFAWEQGHVICKKDAEPNQKLHFFDSYILKQIDAQKIRRADNAESVYKRIKCPELLLWIAEASNVENQIIEKASSSAKKVIDTNVKWARNNAGKRILEIIPWQMIETNLIAKH